jgi:hypothetical protein
MESIRALLTRFRQVGVLVLIGLFLIIYIAIGIVYFQQGAQQKEIEEQITKLSAIVAKPLASDEKLRAEYDEANQALAPMTNIAAVEMLVDIAEKCGIDVDPDAGKLRIAPAVVREEKRGGGNYQVLTFSNISVQGDYDRVMAFISDLDSGKTMETMVLKKVTMKQVEVTFGGEEGDRRAEFRLVASAVINMLDDNGLFAVPNPVNFDGGVATNLMGDDSDTEETVEGFPDITTLADEKGYTGTGFPRNGYVLYGHDKTDPEDTTQFVTVNYITTLTTTYYYTCEVTGLVRQFDMADVAIATEYRDAGESKIETVAILDVDIYTKPGE